MLWAWVEGGVIRDICYGEPAECYHPDIAKLYCVLVPDNADKGDSWDGKTLTKPVVIPPPVVVPKKPPPALVLEFQPNEAALYALFAAQLAMARKV